MTTQRRARTWIRHCTLLFALALFGATATFATPSSATQATHDDIVDVAAKAGSFNTLVAAVQAAGLVETLKGDGPFTVFAPTDEAFARLPAGTVETLLMPENKDQLVALLTYHVVPGKITSSDLLSVVQAETVGGKALPIGLRVGEATVIQADVAASNGVIHAIDAVLMPQQEPASTAMARDLIRTAINRGAPLYNQGQADACASIYEVTAQALLAFDAELPPAAQRPLRRALQRMRHSHDASDRAWIMREGLDEAYAALSSRRMTTSSSARH